MGLAAADVAVKHEVLVPVDEFQAFRLFAAPVGGERGHAPGRIPPGSALGEPGLSGQPPPFGFGPARVLLLEQVGQEAELAGRGVLRGLPGHAVCQRQVAGEAHDLFRRGLVKNAAAALPRFLLAHSASFMYLS